MLRSFLPSFAHLTEPVSEHVRRLAGEDVEVGADGGEEALLLLRVPRRQRGGDVRHVRRGREGGVRPEEGR